MLAAELRGSTMKAGRRLTRIDSIRHAYAPAAWALAYLKVASLSGHRLFLVRFTVAFLDIKLDRHWPGSVSPSRVYADLGQGLTVSSFGQPSVRCQPQGETA